MKRFSLAFVCVLVVFIVTTALRHDVAYDEKPPITMPISIDILI